MELFRLYACSIYPQIVVECANRISVNISFLCARLNISTYGGALADREYVRIVAPQFGPKKTVANLCVRLRALEQIISSVWVILSGKGGIRLRRRKTYYLDQMDHSVGPS